MHFRLVSSAELKIRRSTKCQRTNKVLLVQNNKSQETHSLTIQLRSLFLILKITIRLIKNNPDMQSAFHFFSVFVRYVYLCNKHPQN